MKRLNRVETALLTETNEESAISLMPEQLVTLLSTMKCNIRAKAGLLKIVKQTISQSKMTFQDRIAPVSYK